MLQNNLFSLITPLIQLTIVVTMLSAGMQVTAVQILGAVSRKGLMAKALLANLLIIPLAALLFARLFNLPQGLVLGFLLMGVAPGAPLIPKLAEVANADLPFSVGLMFVLAVLAVVTTPVTANFILPLEGTPQGEALQFNVPVVIRSLITLQLLPLLAGLAVQRWLPKLRDVLVRPSIMAANLILVCAILLIILRDYQSLLDLPWTAVAAIVSLIVSMLVVGWLLGGPLTSTRRSLALGTSAQSNGLALLIASSNFPGTGAVITVVAFGLLNIIINFAVAIFWNRRG